jgi:hypothetical protein
MKPNLTNVTDIEFEARIARRMKLALQTKRRGLMSYQAYFNVLSGPYEGKQQNTRFTKEYR